VAADRGADDAQRGDGADEVRAGVRRDGVDGPHVGRVDHGDGEVAGLVGGDREHGEALGELGGDAQEGARSTVSSTEAPTRGIISLLWRKLTTLSSSTRAELEQGLDERELALGAAGLHGGELIVGEQARPHHHGSEETQAPMMIHRRGAQSTVEDARGRGWAGRLSGVAIRGAAGSCRTERSPSPGVLYGPPPVRYLDHNATTPLDPRVRDVVIAVLGDEGLQANPSSVHGPGSGRGR
jgi:hypothetical protein